MTVGETAEATGVTVRTLHHYDRIGLVTPQARSSAGYRLYSDADLDRLQQVVAYRRLGMSLEDIAAVVDAEPGSGGAGTRRALERQRDLIEERLTELTRLLAAVDTALEADMTGHQLTPEEQKELFGTGFDDDYAEEAQERWGATEVWAESRRRTRGYGKAEWERVKADTDHANELAAAALDAGLPADSEQAMDAAEAARQVIDRWFYPLDGEFHRGLGDMYVQDPRFTKTYDDVRPGLAQYLRDAIHANADRLARLAREGEGGSGA